MSACPNCHTSYGWDGHHCMHCDAMTAINIVGNTTNAVAGVIWLADEFSPLIHDPAVQESVSNLLGDSLSTLGDVLGDHLGEIISGI